MSEYKAGCKQGRLLVVSGPSGSGKSTLCREAVKRTGARLSVSATTRKQSEQEVEGKDYYFLSVKEFEEKIARNEFLEYARVFDHYYGTPVKPVQEQLGAGETVILEIDVQGAGQVFERFGEAVGILVLPPKPEILQQRLTGRGRDDMDTINKRLAKGREEIEQAEKIKNFQHTIINDELEEAIKELVALINTI